MDLVIPHECLPFIRVQRTYLNLSREPSDEKVKQIYNERIKRDHQEYVPFIDSSIKKIIAIGCGIGGAEAALKQAFPQAELWLLDGTDFNVHFKGTVKETSNAGWHDKDTSVYNSRELTELFMAANGVEIAGWYELGTKERLEADLFFSLSSWGHHYPLSTYDAHGRILTDLRRGKRENDEILRTLAQRNGRVINHGHKCDRVIFTN